MKGEYPYKNLDQVMRGIKHQIVDSYDWCYKNIPEFENPFELWEWLKTNTQFEYDPEGVELVQTSGTLFDKNEHGKSGSGDCDCFATTVIAAFHTQGWDNCGIILSGYNKNDAVHIYNYIDWDGKRYIFDLTEPLFNSERGHPYKQILPVTFKQIDMATLKLAEPSYMSLSEGIADLYINVPDPTSGKIIKVREDKFDDLPDDVYTDFMEAIEPYNTYQHMNGFLSKWRQNKADKRDERRQYHIDKLAAGGGISGVIGGIGKVASSIFGGGAAAGAAGGLPTGSTSTPPFLPTKGFSVDVNAGNMPPPTWWDNNKKWALPVGIGLLVFGAIALMKKKKKSTRRKKR